MQEKTEKIHDYNGRDYRTVWQHPRSKFEDYFESAVARKLLPKYGGWFIDVGGGYARSYPLYKKEGRKVVITDYAMNLLQIASQNNKDDKNIFFVAADAYHLPFKENTFNGGISIRVFHHMNLPDKFLGEIFRVMGTGSKFVMDYANKFNPLRIIAKPHKSFKKDHEEYEPLLFGTHPTFFKKTSKQVGYKYLTSLGTGFFPRFITEKTVFLSPIFYVLEFIFDNTLGYFDLGPRTVALIKKPGEVVNENINDKDIKDILICPLCSGDLDFSDPTSVTCKKCSKKFAINKNIYDFRKSLA